MRIITSFLMSVLLFQLNAQNFHPEHRNGVEWEKSDYMSFLFSHGQSEVVGVSYDHSVYSIQLQYHHPYSNPKWELIIQPQYNVFEYTGTDFINKKGFETGVNFNMLWKPGRNFYPC